MVNTCSAINKAKTYKLFKDSFTTEYYIKPNLRENERFFCFFLAQLRCGSLPLRIVTDRYNGKQINDRLCLFCDSSHIESETQFVVSYDFYTRIKSDIFGEIFNTEAFMKLSLNHKLCYLMINHVLKLAKFIVKAYVVRRRALYPQN